MTNNLMTFFSRHPLLHSHMRHILPTNNFFISLRGVHSPNSAPFWPHSNKKCLEHFFRRLGEVHLHPLHPLAMPMSPKCHRRATITCRRLRQIRRRIGAEVTTQLVLTLVTSRLDYCNAVLAGVPQSTLEPLQCVQNAAARLVHQMNVRDHVTPSVIALYWLPVRCRIDFKLCLIMSGVHTGRCSARISKTSSVRPAAQQRVQACDRVLVASTRRHG